jgi:pimeloyl-ACP methyl ester carboxylesterase
MSIAHCNGINLHYEVAGSGYPVILIQGLGGDGASWAFQRDALAQSFRVVTFDNRGVGKSDKPEGTYTTELMAADTVALLDHLGIDHAFIMGASMGGMIAQEIALRWPQRVRGLNLICTYSEVDPYCVRWFDVQRYLAEYGSKEFRVRQSSLWLFHPQFFEQQPDEIVRIERSLIDNAQPLHAYLAQWEACVRHNTTARLGQVSMPVLVCVGRDDIITHVEMSRRLHASIPQSRLALIDGCGHGLLWEKPDEVNQLALDFFKGLPAMDPSNQAE